MSSLSPRIYPRPWYTHSTLGGWFGAELKYAGYDARDPERPGRCPGLSGNPRWRGQAAGRPDLWGLDARETQLALKQPLGARDAGAGHRPGGGEPRALRHRATRRGERGRPQRLRRSLGQQEPQGDRRARERRRGGRRPGRPAARVSAAGRFDVAPARRPGRRLRKQRTAPKPVCSQACTFNCTGQRLWAARRWAAGTPGVCIGGVWRGENSMSETPLLQRGSQGAPAGVSFGAANEAALHELCNSLGLDLWFRLVMQPWLIRCTSWASTRSAAIRSPPRTPPGSRRFMRAPGPPRGAGRALRRRPARAPWTSWRASCRRS